MRGSLIDIDRSTLMRLQLNAEGTKQHMQHRPGRCALPATIAAGCRSDYIADAAVRLPLWPPMALRSKMPGAHVSTPFSGVSGSCSDQRCAEDRISWSESTVRFSCKACSRSASSFGEHDRSVRTHISRFRARRGGFGVEAGSHPENAGVPRRAGSCGQIYGAILIVTRSRRSVAQGAGRGTRTLVDIRGASARDQLASSRRG